jgi:WD40 repeat protein
VTFSADGKILAFGSGEEVRLWDVIKVTEIRVLKGHTQIIRSLAFSPDAKTLVSGTGDFEQIQPTRAEIKVWDVTSGKERGELKASWAPACVAIDPDGKIVASAGFYDPVKLWELSTLKELASIKIEGNRLVNSLAFAPNGKTLACGCADETIRLFDISKIQEERAKR